MSSPAGCALELLDEQACLSILKWIVGQGSPPPPTNDVTWLLSHCDDGVVWGQRIGEDSTWDLSSFHFSYISPQIEADGRSLQQLRLFSRDQEIFVWREAGALKGRMLKDLDISALPYYLVPVDEYYIILGDRLINEERGFSLVGSASGTRQAVPLECSDDDFNTAQSGTRWPLRLKVRHYLEQDQASGLVRICASRLADLIKWPEQQGVQNDTSTS